MRTNLELYILTLLRDGLGTPYELNSRAGLSLGSSIPALGRLQRESLIKASEPRPRRSRRYSITSKGLRVLQEEWRQHLSEDTTDLDSILRIACLAWIHSSAKAAGDYLVKAARHVRALAKMAESDAERFGSSNQWPDNEKLLNLRARMESQRLAASASELASIAEELKKSRSNGSRRATKTRIKKT